MRKLLIILGVAFALSQLIYFFIERGIKKFNCISYPKLNEMINGTVSYDVLFMGASRTQSHIDPSIIDSATRLNTYNAGRSGSNSLEARMLLEAYLARHKPPACIVYNIEPLTVRHIRQVPNPTLYLFFLDNKIIRQGVAGTFSSVGLLRAAPFLRVFYFDDYTRYTALLGHTSQCEKNDEVACYKGYESTRRRVLQTVRVDTIGESLENAGIAEVIRIIDLCKKNKIRLLFHSAPVTYYKGQPTRSQRVPVVDSLAQAMQIAFIRFDTCRNYTKDEFFDLDHLNRAGSQKYSRLLGRVLVQNGIHK